MKLRNKKTGEIVYKHIAIRGHNEVAKIYGSLTELCEDWEDAPEEPKEDGLDNIIALVEAYSNNDSERYPKEIVEKLKAWKLLTDMGFKIEGIRYRNNKSYIEWSISQKVRDEHFMSEDFNEALHFLFGGEK